MLNNYAKILMEMISPDFDDEQGTIDDKLHNLEIDPELKAILYECIHAKDKVLERDQENYDNTLNQFIMKEKLERLRRQFENQNSDTMTEKDF